MQVRAPSLISTMVTRTVICVSPSEAATLAAEASWSSAEADLIIKKASTSTCHSNSSDNKSDGGKKRALPSEDVIGGNEIKKRLKKADGFEIDLSDVPRQQPIPKSKRHMKEGSSKYAGVSFSKTANKWLAQILIEGTNRRIGTYVNEEEAAIDYARAVFKYKGQEALNNLTERNSSGPAIDLSDVPPQLPIPKSKGHIKEGASKFTGVCPFDPLSRGNNNENRGRNNKRPLPSEDVISGEEIKKRQKADAFVLDLSDVPPQPPIPKSGGRMKEGASKYAGVSFDKSKNKWKAAIMIEGKKRHIGYYESEEEAAIDYARAAFKYKGQDALDKARGQKMSGSAIVIDLSDVPSIPPILKNAGEMKEGSSKYVGVSFEESSNKWEAQIAIEGKQYSIGCYEIEVFAAVDYARAVLKYQGQRALDKARQQNSSGSGPEIIIDLNNVPPQHNIDLFDVPPQPPILKSRGKIKEGASKFTGVTFNKGSKKWHAQITFEGKQRSIGYYENEKEAAIDYARAVFKYKGQDVLNKLREQTSSAPSTSIDLSDVPPQLPITKSKWRIKEGSSKYAGPTFRKANSKWQAAITIEGEKCYIGYYESEEAAAIDYARAVFKYKGQGALDKARERNSDKEIKKRQKQKANGFVFDLSDVPPQPPIPRPEVKGG